MKNSMRYLGGAAAIAAALALNPLAHGQTSVSQTTTSTSDGTISEFTPGTSIVVHREGSTEPLTYSYTKSTTVVDDAGNPVDVSVVKTGLPVQVYYDREGDGMVARKIVVHRHTTGGAAVERSSETTTTTTSEGREHDRDHDHDHDRDHDHER